MSEPTPQLTQRLTELHTALDDLKLTDIQTLHLPAGNMADAMVIATGTSTRHIFASAEKIARHYKTEYSERAPIEGTADSPWVLIDGGAIFIHLMLAETRTLYALEKLWHKEEPAAS